MSNSPYFQIAKRVRMCYDPGGQVVKTINHDDTNAMMIDGKLADITAVRIDADILWYFKNE